MNVSALQVSDEDDRIAEHPPPHDQSEQQVREKTNLDHSGHQQDYGTAFGFRHLHEESVITVRKAAKIASRVLQERISQMKCGHPGKFLSM